MSFLLKISTARYYWVHFSNFVSENQCFIIKITIFCIFHNKIFWFEQKQSDSITSNQFIRWFSEEQCFVFHFTHEIIFGISKTFLLSIVRPLLIAHEKRSSCADIRMRPPSKASLWHEQKRKWKSQILGIVKLRSKTKITNPPCHAIWSKLIYRSR